MLVGVIFPSQCNVVVGNVLVPVLEGKLVGVNFDS
jgi:hypothetical protein